MLGAASRETAMTMPHQDRIPELGKLFAELGEVYGRARAGVDAPATTSVCLHVREESAKASAIIKRIREIQGL
jgi:hypothetical protein